MSTSAAQIAGMSNNMALEHVWQVITSHLTGGVSDVFLPNSLKPFLGEAGISAIVGRYSSLIQAPAVVYLDEKLDAICITGPAPGLQGHPSHSVAASLPVVPKSDSAPSAASGAIDKVQGPIQPKQDKVPRPPNPFILYRQHHHPLLKQAHPELHNNEISVILGNQWKAETEETKKTFKEMANAIKQKHQQSHPDYQYQPRKPSEKKRRMTRRKAVALSLTSESPGRGSTVEPSPTSPAQPVSFTDSAQEDLDVIPSLSAIALPASTVPGESAATTAHEHPEDTAAEEVPAGGEGALGWTEEGNNIVTANIPLDAADLALYNLLTEFNEQASSPEPHASNFSIPDVPLGSRLTEQTQYEEDFIFSLVDWDQVDREAAEIKESLAAEYSLLESH